jgi:hypothetical protein
VSWKSWMKKITSAIVGLILLLLHVGCQKAEKVANVQIKMPRSDQGRSSESLQALSVIDQSRLCYAANVKGPGIPTTSKTCDIVRGIAAGLVAGGETISLVVPEGVNREVEIYGLLRDSADEPCPTLQDSTIPVNPRRVYRLGSKVGLTVKAPITETSIVIQLTTEDQNLIGAGILPSSCAPDSRLRITTGRFSSGKQNFQQTLNGYSVTSRVGSMIAKPETTTVNGYKVRTIMAGVVFGENR